MRGKLSSTVLKTSGFREKSAEFNNCDLPFSSWPLSVSTKPTVASYADQGHPVDHRLVS